MVWQGASQMWVGGLQEQGFLYDDAFSDKGPFSLQQVEAASIKLRDKSHKYLHISIT
jgi:hypothetical protein